MKYLGVNYDGGVLSAGLFDSSRKQFLQSRHIDVDRLMGSLYYGYYAKHQNLISYTLLRLLVWKRLKQLLDPFSIKETDHVTLTSHSGSLPFLANTGFLVELFSGKEILHSDHFWGHINAVKYHPEFRYPALVVDSSALHTIAAYIPDPKRIKILYDGALRIGPTYFGLGKICINIWVSSLKEDVSWPGQPRVGKYNVYDLYSKRGKAGRAIIRLEREIKEEKDIFCHELFMRKFPEMMQKYRGRYGDEEEYRNDWVATQWQLLRDILDSARDHYLKELKIRTSFISGGISRNPALGPTDWKKVPIDLANDEGGGCFMAYLGYHVKEIGLVIEHERWKDNRYAF